MPGSVVKAYAALVEAGELRPDPDQARAVQALDRFARDMAGPKPGLLGRLFGKTARPARGVYLWGGVGRGKSMLMDLAYDHVPVEPKCRTHFHAFMIDVHARLREARRGEEGDPVIRVAEQIAGEVRFLAFDEMMVTNSADAMIMSRLFTALLDGGVGLVTTSNRPPDDLYRDGLNRELFLPFINLIEERLEVLPLNGPTDYRLDRMRGLDTWLVPNGPEATEKLRAAFFQLTDHPVEDRSAVPSETLDVGSGRTLEVPKSLKGVAVFSFKKLCGEARGAADYLAVARRFHTVILVGVPVMTREMRNEAARFVTLIDALYEHRVKLLAAADAEPNDLYPAGDGRFEFERTVSRLEEMQSADYLGEGHGLSED
ncbi:AFG1 family ATPase [Sphingomonas xanthus]|uniref:AFG1 family ATPase n=2 Tax=Sphingomonas xanthus TaxID=2594473 RepID=A0A516IUD2_9SPHN|nr:cell division protein ZapE [Sphingomonas xanthus]QDP20503.1 AFG1 family ATPase [Sphingomonas xanthus]